MDFVVVARANLLVPVRIGRQRRDDALCGGCMSKMREAARGKDCKVNLPGICNFDPSTTVGAHLRDAGTAGVAIKPHDLFMVDACFDCHREIDRVTMHFDDQELDAHILRALIRTQMERLKEGLIHVEQ